MWCYCCEWGRGSQKRRQQKRAGLFQFIPSFSSFSSPSLFYQSSYLQSFLLSSFFSSPPLYSYFVQSFTFLQTVHAFWHFLLNIIVNFFLPFKFFFSFLTDRNGSKSQLKFLENYKLTDEKPDITAVTFAFGPILLLATEQKSKDFIDHPTQKEANSVQQRSSSCPYLQGVAGLSRLNNRLLCTQSKLVSQCHTCTVTGPSQHSPLSSVSISRYNTEPDADNLGHFLR